MKRLRVFLILLFTLLFSGCGKFSIPLVTGNATPTSEPLPTITATTTPTPLPWWLAPRPRDMESYGLKFDPEATPRVPPWHSVDMHIWGNDIPYQLITGIPQFTKSEPLESQADIGSLIEGTGCTIANYGYLDCPPGNPLALLGCETIQIAPEVLSNSGIEGQYTGTCHTQYLDDDQPRDEYLYRVGCAFRRNASQIYRVGDEYRLINDPDELRGFFGRIESPEEALTFAQAMTGLTAQLSFEYDETFLYFQEEITGTNVLAVEGGYLLNLFHFNVCSCEPWITSQVMLQVSHDGEITWLEAVPLWMTTGLGCAD